MTSDILSVETRQVSYNTELVGVNNTANEVLIGASTYNDIWGYTAADGNEYALVGSETGTSITSKRMYFDQDKMWLYINGVHKDDYIEV